MKIRLTSSFLAFLGVLLSVYNMFHGGSVLTYFLFGACFGLIYVNYQEKKGNS